MLFGCRMLNERFVFLTCNCELSLCADSSSVIAGNAGVVAIVFERHLGYLERAHELLSVDGDA